MPDTPSKSRLSSQLVALGLEEPGRADPRHVESEQSFMAGLDPLPLDLPAGKDVPRRKAATHWRVSVPVLLAAGAALMIFRPWQTEEAGWRVKGAGHVELYADVGGNVLKLEPKASLPSGAKVRVQVTAAGDIVAFSGVVNDSRELLSDAQAVWDERLRLKAGEKGFFPGSVELFGAAEGETMIVVTCPAASGNALDTAALQDIMQRQAVGLSGCDLYTQKLR